MAKIVTLTPEVRAVLERSSIKGNTLRLPEQLTADLYRQVNRVIESAGGKWNRGHGVHIFGGDPKESLGLIFSEGRYVNATPEKLRQQALQAYYTPPELAEKVVRFSTVRGKRVLEPSCGCGALVHECLKQGADWVTAVEFDHEGFAHTSAYLRPLPKTLYATFCADFLKLDSVGEKFERVVMNPPFTDGLDFEHVRHALAFVKDPRSVLVSIVAGDRNWAVCQSRVTAELQRSPFSFDFSLHRLPSESFKESGTLVETAIIRVTNVRRILGRDQRGTFVAEGWTA